MDTLKFIIDKYNIASSEDHPIVLPHKRDELTRLFKHLDFKVGAEIGVDRGLYAEEMSRANPGVKLFCIDPWKTYSDYDDFKDQHILNVNYNNTIKRLAPYNCEIIKKSSVGAIKDFENESLDFVYIDGNHTHEYALQDIRLWTPKVKVGGIVSGHDYIWRNHRRDRFDVKNAVDLFVKENNIEKLFMFEPSSWFFVKNI